MAQAVWGLLLPTFVHSDPIGRIAANDRRRSWNNLVGRGQQSFRDGEAERFGGFEVYDQIDFCRLLDRQVGRLVAFEDAPGIHTNLVENIGEAGASRVGSRRGSGFE